MKATLVFLDRLVAEGFVRPEHRAMAVVATNTGALLDGLLASPS